MYIYSARKHNEYPLDEELSKEQLSDLAAKQHQLDLDRQKLVTDVVTGLRMSSMLMLLTASALAVLIVAGVFSSQWNTYVLIGIGILSAVHWHQLVMTEKVCWFFEEEYEND